MTIAAPYNMALFLSHLRSITAACSLLVLAACSTMGVSTAKAPDVDLSKYKTFAWAPDMQSNGRSDATILDQTVKTSVNQQLRNKGLSPATDVNSADMLISYTATSVPNYTFGEDYSYWEWLDWGPGQRVRFFELRLADPKSKKVIWEGTASDVIGDRGESQQQIMEAVRDLFKEYPQS